MNKEFLIAQLEKRTETLEDLKKKRTSSTWNTCFLLLIVSFFTPLPIFVPIILFIVCQIWFIGKTKKELEATYTEIHQLISNN